MTSNSIAPAWDVTCIQRLLMTAAKKGARIAADHPAICVESPLAETFHEAFAGKSRGEADDALAEATSRIETDHPALDPEDREITAQAIAAAMVRGQQMIARIQPASRKNLRSVADDEMALAPHVERLLIHLVGLLTGSGRGIPGANRLIDRVTSTPAPRILRSGSPAQQELRTEWIADHDTGHPYQWCVRRRGHRIHIERRLCGHRSMHGGLSIRVAEMDIVLQMLEEVSRG